MKTKTKTILIAGLCSPLSLAFASEAELNARIDTLEEQLNATAEMIDSLDTATSNTHLGGYGELHYSKNKNANDEIDFHRFVLFVSHQFSDTISFHSELELEHSIAGNGDDKKGEIELEQAYIDIKVKDNLLVRSGLFLLPVGIINETHEPNTFYGVERNLVETNIIPATWWEGGIGVSGIISQGLSYDVYAHSGLKTSTENAYQPRKSRQKVGEAPANDFAYTGRIKYTGIPGLEVAGTLQYQTDLTQSAGTSAGSAILYEGHVVYNKAGFGLRALYAGWSLSGDGPKNIGADKQNGWYLEPSYKFMGKYGVFARYSSYNNKAGSDAEATTQTDVGINYWPHPNVVFKADYIKQGNAGSNEAVNLGIGYQF
ncbi:MAG TPA: porin [Gammaproteobacteria bacterium]|nr:porin [Gammaproteobacteria bacterium]